MRQRTWSALTVCLALVQACAGDWEVRDKRRDGGSPGEPDGSEQTPERDADPEGGGEPNDGGDASIDPAPDDAGDAGEEPALRVLSTSPADGTVLEGVDEPVRVTLSAAVEPSTLSAETFQVLRGGEPVLGSVEHDGEEIRFVPRAPWPLGAAYRVELGDGIQDVEGSALAPLSFEFNAREGEYRTAMFRHVQQGDAQLAMTPGGAAALVFRLGGPPELWASRFGPASGWSDPVKISTSTTVRPHQRVSLSMNDAGVIAVAWDHYDYPWFTVYDDGAWLAPNLKLSTGYSPALVLSASQNWLVYRKFDPMLGADAVMGSTGPLDEIVEANYRLSADGASGDRFDPPRAALLGDSGVAVWCEGAPGAGRIDARLMSGSTWFGAPTKTLSGDGLVATAPALASDTQHRAAIAVWQQVDSDWTNVWAARAIVGGGFGPALVVSDRKGSATHPQVAVAANGHALAVWQQEVGDRAQIAAAHYTPAGGWAKPEFISDTAQGPCGPPAIAIEPGGNAIAAWVRGDATPGGVAAVWVARYVLGLGWQASQRRALSTHAVQESEPPRVAIDARGRAFVVWSEVTTPGQGFDSDLWVARFE